MVYEERPKGADRSAKVAPGVAGRLDALKALHLGHPGMHEQP